MSHNGVVLALQILKSNSWPLPPGLSKNPNPEDERAMVMTWSRELGTFSDAHLDAAAREVITTCEQMPTLHAFRAIVRRIEGSNEGEVAKPELKSGRPAMTNEERLASVRRLKEVLAQSSSPVFTGEQPE